MAMKSRVSSGRVSKKPESDKFRNWISTGNVNRVDPTSGNGSAGPVVITRPANPNIALLAFNHHIADELKARIKHIKETGHGALLNGTDEQEAIWNEMLNSHRHIVINATAGSGKTTVLVQGCLRLGGNVEAKTYHSLGMSAVTKAFGKVDVEKFKVWGILDQMTMPVAENMEKLFKVRVVKMISLAKQYGESDRKMLDWIVDHHDVELNGMEELVLDLVPKVLVKCKAQVKTIDYDDMIWLPRVLELPVPRFDLVMSDESQDLNVMQQYLALKSGDRHVVVGDRNQCHPAGVMIEITNKPSKPIQEIQVGDYVVTYHSCTSNFRGIASQGRKVQAIHQEHYDGDMLRLSAGDKSVESTPNHKWLVRLDSGRKSHFTLYLMMRGTRARIGICRMQYHSASGIGNRCRTEKAEKAWILDAFETIEEARIAELIAQSQFGLPSLIFEQNMNRMPGAQPAFIEAVYSGIGDLTDRAKECLEYYGRDYDYPIYDLAKEYNYVGVYSFVTEACNIISGYMQVKLFDGSTHGGRWRHVRVSKRHYKGIVYGITVEPTEGGRRLYIANGVVSHNSCYSFRGADQHSMDNMETMLAGDGSGRGVVDMPLTLTRRCPKGHVKLVNGLVPQIRALDSAPQGKIEVIEYQQALNGMKPGDMVLCRVNAELVITAYRLLRMGIKAVVRGRDVAEGIVRLVEKSEQVNGGHTLTVPELVSAAGKITDEECARFMSMPNGRGEMRAITSRDKYGCLMCLCEGVRTSCEVVNKVKLLFAAKDEEGNDNHAVVLSSIHRGKGLEAGTVWILRPDLMPHPAAKQAHDVQQEMNLAYIACTRAKWGDGKEGRLVFVGQMCRLFGEQGMEMEDGDVQDGEL